MLQPRLDLLDKISSELVPVSMTQKLHFWLFPKVSCTHATNTCSSLKCSMMGSD